MDSTSRGSLMVRAQNGDTEAYNMLLKDLLPMLTGFIESRVGFLGMTDDIVQETLLAVHKARHSYDGQQSFNAWMFAIARYKMVDHIRKASRQTQKFKDVDDIDKLPSIVEREDSYNDQTELVRAALSKLPSKYRDCITLTKIKGHTVEEAAKQLNLSIANVKTRCSRGYKMLYTKLEHLLHES
ncbi:RNA polymerase sigma factor [Pseudobacteriovorax antillogorgiicola]|uniref:RNA polymerase, sigma subunit, ECF family n=1 Tax=Pseudobacteriovorax antillogorgiicola TaxID=1513793 RepID=A0A1Y6CEB9_9BACT|nr:RNA polymerase sigma factor [Pseudobacteriovorax antillogorgiicola]TCS48295.1 RNA polymerase ECF family sigma subunit [Pseudobacteriovorax antillogorgiicola]SMF56845.1 RNA polymerase, sigma subunit, ECF family [Pseudobacteriovorax antillogorgiicola]